MLLFKYIKQCTLGQAEDNIYSYVYRNYTYFFYDKKQSKTIKSLRSKNKYKIPHAMPA